MDEADKTPSPLIARIARGLGAFNIVYGGIGLLSAVLLRFAMPQELNPLPDAALAVSAAAGAWIVIQGIVLRIYGPAALTWAIDGVKRAKAGLTTLTTRLRAGRRSA
jgi:hypothetical protein